MGDRAKRLILTALLLAILLDLLVFAPWPRVFPRRCEPRPARSELDGIYRA